MARNTLNYYRNHSLQFFENTVNVDMTVLYDAFLKYLPAQGKILDLGCGSGRDTKYFHDQGYQVEAVDYALELVQLAQSYTGLPIRYESFYDLKDWQSYDGIWACASLLHCERDELYNVMNRIVNALKITGICYLSFKYGTQDRVVNERAFTDLDEDQAQDLFKAFKHIELIKIWQTSDQRADRQETWLNILFRKVNDKVLCG